MVAQIAVVSMDPKNNNNNNFFAINNFWKLHQEEDSDHSPGFGQHYKFLQY